MKSNIRLNNGMLREGKTRYRTGIVAIPAANTIEVNSGESIGSIALRAYGANTETNRNKILNANGTLTGIVRIPK